MQVPVKVTAAVPPSVELLTYHEISGDASGSRWVELNLQRDEEWVSVQSSPFNEQDL
jgi:hypothetical protein